MKLVILGNGFDMHHGLRTSFSDFRKYLINNNNKGLVNSIDSIISYNRKIMNNHDFEIAWNDFEKILGDYFVKNKSIKSNLEKTESTMQHFAKEFLEYIKKVSRNHCIINPTIQNEIKDADIILTFNYTKTYTLYTLNKNVKIFHIHGSIADNILPIIGCYDKKIDQDKSSTDYAIRFKSNIVHKLTLAFKHNTHDLDEQIENFLKINSNKIKNIVSIGYSYGESDMHVYEILNRLLVEHSKNVNIPYDEWEGLEIINYKLFNYESNESNRIKNRIIERLYLPHRRRAFVNVFGNKSYDSHKKELIKFTLIDY